MVMSPCTQRLPLPPVRILSILLSFPSLIPPQVVQEADRGGRGDRGHQPGQVQEGAAGDGGGRAGTNCIKIGLPGKLILSKRKGLREVLFS